MKVEGYKCLGGGGGLLSVPSKHLVLILSFHKLGGHLVTHNPNGTLQKHRNLHWPI